MRTKGGIQEPGQSLGLGGLDFLTFDSVVSASRAHAPVHWALTPGQHPDEAGRGMGPGHARPPPGDQAWHTPGLPPWRQRLAVVEGLILWSPGTLETLSELPPAIWWLLRELESLAGEPCGLWRGAPLYPPLPHSGSRGGTPVPQGHALPPSASSAAAPRAVTSSVSGTPHAFCVPS